MYINLHVIIIKTIKDRRLMHFFLYVGEHRCRWSICITSSLIVYFIKCWKKINVGHSWDYRVQINEMDA